MRGSRVKHMVLPGHVISQQHTLHGSLARRQRAEADSSVATGASGWGWLPTVSLISALGLLIVAYAYSFSRQDASWALPLYWAGLITFFAPIAARQLWPTVSRWERIGLVVLLALGLYLVKLEYNPLAFAFHDEFPHWRTVNDIVQHQRLFEPNSLQPISAVYPGLEIVTAALTQISGLSITTMGLVVIGVARLLVMLAVFLCYERISGSARIAGIGSLLYVAYPNSLYWSTQFSYESLALPLSIVVILILIRGSSENRAVRLSYQILCVLLIEAIVVTHHVSSYVLVVFLVLVTIAARFPVEVERLVSKATRGRWTPESSIEQRRTAAGFGWFWALALVSSLLWMTVTNNQVVDYIGPHLAHMRESLLGVFAQEETTRTLFKGATSAFVTPWWERLIGLVGTLAFLVVIPFGLILAWFRYRSQPLAVVLALGAFVYPFMVALRFLQTGTEISARASNFLFFATAFIVAVALVEIVTRRLYHVGVALATVFTTLVFAGGVVIGMPYWARLPGPYTIMPDTRGINAESVSAASWARDALGAGNRVIADRANTALMGSYGEQDTIEGLSWLFFTPELESEQIADMHRRRLDYVVIDRRMTTALPVSGSFYEGGEPFSGQHVTPMKPELLNKFDLRANVSRIFDSGNIQMYDISGLSQQAP